MLASGPRAEGAGTGHSGTGSRPPPSSRPPRLVLLRLRATSRFHKYNVLNPSNSTPAIHWSCRCYKYLLTKDTSIFIMRSINCAHSNSMQRLVCYVPTLYCVRNDSNKNKYKLQVWIVLNECTVKHNTN